jgi:hypothetical protein
MNLNEKDCEIKEYEVFEKIKSYVVFSDSSIKKSLNFKMYEETT